MGNPFTSATVSSYNSNPPADDGSQVAANRVQWSTQKTKLTDPIKTALESDISNTNTAFAKVVGGGGITTTATDYTISASDQGKLVKVSATATITTPDATVVGSPFVVGVSNTSSVSITLDGSGAQTIDGADSITIPAGNGVWLNTDGTNWFTFGQNFTRSFPPPSSFKNLSIKVASNTTVTVAADFVATTNGSAYQTTAVSSTINLGTTGVDALDTGTVAVSTWYAIWVIVKADGTTKCLASTSATSPTMPTGYTYKARIGWVRTVSGSATLYGTWQLGNRAQYVVGLAQTAAGITMGTGASGSVSVPTWTAIAVASFIPSTASEIFLSIIMNQSGAGNGIMVAPNNSYGAISSTTNPPPLGLSNNNSSIVWSESRSGSFLIESSNIYFAAAGSSTAVFCNGWSDNI